MNMYFKCYKCQKVVKTGLCNFPSPDICSSPFSIPAPLRWIPPELGRTCHTPCRCYRQKHSRNTKWSHWSRIDLWSLDPPQHNSVPFHSHSPRTPPLPERYPNHTPILSLLPSLFPHVREFITGWLVVSFVSGGLPPTASSPFMSCHSRFPAFFTYKRKINFLVALKALLVCRASR